MSSLVEAGVAGTTAALVTGANVDTDADGGFKPDDHPIARLTHVQPADAGEVPDAGQARRRRGHPSSP